MRIKLKRYLNFSILFLGMKICNYVFAGEIVVPPTTVYLDSNGDVRASSLGSFTSDLERIYQSNFDQCKESSPYSCVLLTITGNAPGANSVQINGIYNWYQLTRNAHFESMNTDGVMESSDADGGGIAAHVAFLCPKGFAQRSTGPSNDKEIDCVKIENPSCPRSGNPIQISSGTKIEYEVDYTTTDGILKIERRYISQSKGWTMDDFPRLLVVDAEGTLSVSNQFVSFAGTTCPYLDITTYKGFDYQSGSGNPGQSQTYNLNNCLDVINDLPVRVAHVWIQGDHYRFLESESKFIAEGLLAGC